MKILIAEDTLSDRMLLRFHLAKLGHQVSEVQNGEELVNTLKDSYYDWDLLIVDLNMPIKSGEEAAREIRALQTDSPEDWIPIIFLSGSGTDEDIQRCIEAGADDYLIKPIQHKVLAAKLLAMARIANMRNRLVSMNKRLEALSTTDYLTELPNRRAFEISLTDEMAKAARYEQALSVAVLDIDHFKRINDEYGHDVGDEVLRQVSARLKSSLRKGDVIGRIGGEEFGLCLSHTSAEDAVNACERYRKAISGAPIICGEHKLNLTVSLGVTAYCDNLGQLELIKLADKALYEAKAKGRNRTIYRECE
ncbi:diguanylate cyclase [Rhodanobacter aciditrophus]|uniref:diguanylate cyclase n=1 Tax=Rhodanobacter aciditrophus TaxID=1623218 RepID=A0ABW4B187_9GAMM